MNIENVTMDPCSCKDAQQTEHQVENYLQAWTDITFRSFLRLLINVVLAFNTLYATGISLLTTNPRFGGGQGPLGWFLLFFILSLAARRNSTIGIGNGLFSFLE